MEDTICAIATSLGVGAISIIRLSGKDAIEKVNSIFSRDLTNVNSHSVTYGHIVYKNEIIDDDEESGNFINVFSDTRLHHNVTLLFFCFFSAHPSLIPAFCGAGFYKKSHARPSASPEVPK